MVVYTWRDWMSKIGFYIEMHGIKFKLVLKFIGHRLCWRLNRRVEFIVVVWMVAIQLFRSNGFIPKPLTLPQHWESTHTARRNDWVSSWTDVNSRRVVTVYLAPNVGLQKIQLEKKSNTVFQQETDHWRQCREGLEKCVGSRTCCNRYYRCAIASLADLIGSAISTGSTDIDRTAAGWIGSNDDQRTSTLSGAYSPNAQTDNVSRIGPSRCAREQLLCRVRSHLPLRPHVPVVRVERGIDR
jgi:hypothetical protein